MGIRVGNWAGLDGTLVGRGTGQVCHGVWVSRWLGGEPGGSVAVWVSSWLGGESGGSATGFGCRVGHNDPPLLDDALSVGKKVGMRREEYRCRKATRSHRHDYDRPGTYFVTICTFNREPILGAISDDVLELNQLGRIVEGCWQQLPLRFRYVSLDAFVIMPNHVHGVIVLTDDVAPTSSLQTVVGAFKSDAARRVNNVRSGRGVPVWQRSFHDQIIRDDLHFERVRAYIRSNPSNWQYDEENPLINK